MRTPLTLQRLFLGLNGMAIEGKKLHIDVIPERDNAGEVVGTKWELSLDTQYNDDGDLIKIKDYLAGYKIDNEDFNMPMKFYDANGTFPRLVADRISTLQKYTRKTKKIKDIEGSAFAQLLSILIDYYDYIDDEIISILQNVKIIKAKCGLVYPLLIEIPENIQTNEDLLKHFYSLGIITVKNTDLDIIAKQIEQYMNTLDEETIQNIRKDYLIRNKIRYWKKVLVLNNGKRYWLSNHIFINAIKPFKELMIDLTGIEINKKSKPIQQEDNTSNSNINDNNINIKIATNINTNGEENKNQLDNLINNAFSF